MAKLFQTEMTRMEVIGHSPFEKDEAEFLRDSLTARKRSLLPIGNSYIILYILNANMVFKHKKIEVQSMMMRMMITMTKKMTKKTKTTKKVEDEGNKKCCLDWLIFLQTNLQSKNKCVVIRIHGYF